MMILIEINGEETNTTNKPYWGELMVLIPSRRK